MQEPSVTPMTDPLGWHRFDDAICKGHTNVFFAPSGERPGSRELREERARKICCDCPVLMECRTWAREQREYPHPERI
jgi:WhiB family redox-sensing transcriptional regulator